MNHGLLNSIVSNLSTLWEGPRMTSDYLKVCCHTKSPTEQGNHGRDCSAREGIEPMTS